MLLGKIGDYGFVRLSVRRIIGALDYWDVNDENVSNTNISKETVRKYFRNLSYAINGEHLVIIML